jgi:hypothetical protein
VDLLKLYLDSDLNINLYLNSILLIIVILILLILFFIIKYRNRSKFKSFEIDQTEIGLGNQKIILKLNYEDAQIAYKFWVEISTRKIGLPIDYDNDVIFEIYTSWYEFFGLTRELIKNIPINRILKDQSTKDLVNISIEVLNVGLRPHLTLWQAKFRRWYEMEINRAENIDKFPQEIQKHFPQYAELIKDMKIVNDNLINYRSILSKLVFEK